MIKDRIAELGEKYRDYTAENLSKLVQTKSYSSKEEDVCRLIVRLCEEAGFDEAKIEGLGSVVARVGNGPKTLAFDAHIDTVEVGNLKNWDFDPFAGTIKDGLVMGRGASDQKGGAASMITAGRILKELGYGGEYTILFTFTVMEEDCDGMCWKYMIEEENIKPDMIVSTEPTSCRLYRGHRGRMEIRVILRGISCHGSAPERGVSAAYKAASACSTVLTLALPRPKTVPRVVSTTFSAKASITGLSSKSMRWNLYPWFTGAGLNVASIAIPVCNPFPLTVNEFFNVHCFINVYLIFVCYIVLISPFQTLLSSKRQHL